MVSRTRRAFLGAALTAGTAALSGCASEPGTAPVAPAPGQPLRWRTLQGGFLVPTLPAIGVPPVGTSGMFVRWISPVALALRDNDLLVADRASGRLWWADLAGPNMTGIAGVQVSPDTQLMIGPDRTAWVLEPAARRVLRFARSGQLLQTASIGTALPSPVAMTLVDGGATLLVADGMSGDWGELRSATLLRTISPQYAGGGRISGVDALAVAPDATLLVLDRLAAAVHVVDRDGRVLRTLGRGQLQQPVALAADRIGRVYVHDLHDASIKRLRPDAPPWRWSAVDLGVQRIGALAVDGWLLAVSDALGGQVQIHSFAHDREP